MTKLCNNLVATLMMTVLPDVFAIGVKAGVPAEVLYEAMTAGSGDSAMLRGYFQRMLSGARAPVSFPAVVVKDVELALGVGREVGVRSEIGEALLSRVKTVLAAGYGGDAYREVEAVTGARLLFEAARKDAPP